MTTTYLRFSSKDEWEQIAATTGIRVNNPILIKEESVDPDTGDIIPAVYEDQWTWRYYTHEWACDDVGIIYNDDGVYDPETGEMITPPTPVEGWHVNYIGESIPQEMASFVLDPGPVTPYRVFA